MGLADPGTGTVGAALHADSAGIPGAGLYAFPDQTFTHTTDQLVTYAGEVLLEPSTKYWTVLTKRASSTVDIWVVESVPSGFVPTAQPGWSLAAKSRNYRNGVWTNTGDVFTTRLEGVVRTPSTVEPASGDFSLDASTLGLLELGTVSSGSLSNRDDRGPVQAGQPSRYVQLCSGWAGESLVS